MLLKSIKLQNFRQYKGIQQVNFSCDNYKNVTIVLGDNTSGKTTLVQAFNWGLYGNAGFNTKDFILNMDIARELCLNEKAAVEVEICLMHDSVDYIITRTQEYTWNSKGVFPAKSKNMASYKQADGQMESIRPGAVDSTISKILPEELSSYFFFDGERIGNISNKQDVTESVKVLLGLAVLDNVKRHLNNGGKNSVISKLKSSMNIEGDQKAAEAFQRMNSEMERKEVIAGGMATVKSEIIHYEARKQQLNDILRENQPTAEFQKKKEILETNIVNETKYYEESSKRLVSNFNNSAIAFFTQPLMKGAMELLKSMDIVDKGVPNMNALSIDFIINRGCCICGNEVVHGNEAYKHLIKEKQYLPPQSIGTMIRIFTKELSVYKSSANICFDNVKNNYTDIHRYKGRIQEWEDEVEDISKKIQGKDNVAKYEQELRDVKGRLRENCEKRENLNMDIGACCNEIDRYQKLYESLSTASGKNKQIWGYINYAQNIYDWIKTNYDSKEQDIKEKLQDKVNEIFCKMYHGKRKVMIDDKYKVSLLTAYEDEDIVMDESRGLETVKNFAFIAGLVDLAREKIVSSTSDNNIDISSEPYPLVMDAPFSNADEKHVSNISKILPDIAEQVIMVVMAKDWAYAEPVMGDKVGKMYKLQKESETSTKIKELNN